MKRFGPLLALAAACGTAAYFVSRESDTTDSASAIVVLPQRFGSTEWQATDNEFGLPAGGVLVRIPLKGDLFEQVKRHVTSIMSLDHLHAPVLAQWDIQNEKARQTHRVATLQQLLTVDGRGVAVAIFDTGHAWAEHAEFKASVANGASRVTREDRPRDDRDHATRVAGTVGALGANEPDAMGVAPGVLMKSYLARHGDLLGGFAVAEISNHSTAVPAGWDVNSDWAGPRGAEEDPRFGQYDVLAASFDGALARRPNHVAVVAAGNDRPEGPRGRPGDPHNDRLPSESARHCVDRHLADARKGGYDTINGSCNSKNVICVGAINDRPGNQPSATTLLSSWGPTDDHRIKPDVVANGQALFSTTMTRPFYDSRSGTSSSAPVVAGLAALIAQHLERLGSGDLLGPRIKALMIHTAEDAGTVGPDPVYGWGIVNGERAAKFLLSSKASLTTMTVANQQTVELALQGDATEAVRATIVWVDPPADVRSRLDDPSPVLLNDVDLELYSPNSTTPHLPYVLQRGDPSLPAVRARNDRDNVEVIDAAPAAGTWKLRLVGHHLTSGSEQRVVVAVSGLKGD